MAEARRNELLLKLFFGAQAPLAVSREHVAATLQQQMQTLKVYEATAKKLKAEAAADPQLPFWLMTLNMGRHHSRAVAAWCRETLAELEALERKEKRNGA